MLSEVLISFFILSIVLFGIDSEGLFALRSHQDAWTQSVAIAQIINMRERLLALQNFEGLDHQIEIWNAENKAVLPHSKGVVTGALPNYEIKLSWGNKKTLKEKITL